MPKIQIRPAVETDIPILVALEHDYVSEDVWQMEIHQDDEDGRLEIVFRPVHLPRSTKVEYPRARRRLADDWTRRAGLLVAELDGDVIGYISMNLDIAPATAWATDLVVARRLRRQGIGTALVLSGQVWAHQHGCSRLVMEMQPKNHPSISLCQKLGFAFCGYNDRYFLNHDIALFFSKSVR